MPIAHCRAPWRMTRRPGPTTAPTT
jgi:hypothetical protein